MIYKVFVKIFSLRKDEFSSREVSDHASDCKIGTPFSPKVSEPGSRVSTPEASFFT